MIASFAKTKEGGETAKIFAGTASNRFPSTMQRAALRKLTYLDSATKVSDLAVPPGNHLHLLTGNRAGQYTIKINDQFRICFVWGEDNNAYDVEIADYH